MYREERHDGFERIVLRQDPATGLKAIFALHDLTLGPALGGVRRWHYRSDQDALADVLALARGMTAKNALAGLPFGGGKSVILAPGGANAAHRTSGPAGRPLTAAEQRRFGSWIEDLGGDYVAAEDVGMSVADLAGMRTATAHVTGIGDRGRGGNPGPRTALGVCVGIGVVAERLGIGLAAATVAVQGLGNVGMALCELLHQAGAGLVVADLDGAKIARAVQRFGATAMPVDRVLNAPVDIIAPCALGGAVTLALAETMPARAIAGSANNQLADGAVAAVLRQRGIRYAPDYVINAGGVISAGLEYLGQDGFEQQARAIGPRLRRIFDRAEALGQPETAVAEAMAREALANGPAAAEATGNAALAAVA